MIALLLALLAQEPCSPDMARLIKSAEERANAFDLEDARQRLETAVTACADADVPIIYLRGWLLAREAYRFGGSPESLRGVAASLSVLNAIKAGGQPWAWSADVRKVPAPEMAGPAEIALLVLQAAAAAAQSERDSMSLLLDQALQLESIRLSAGLSGAPIITAHEAAGDLWLQVHRYEDARRAYMLARERVGATRRVTLGLARTAERMKDAREACRQYRTLVGSWNANAPDPAEIVEARTFLREAMCTGA